MKRILPFIAAAAIIAGCSGGAVEGSLTMVATPTPRVAQASDAPAATDIAEATSPPTATFKDITLKGRGKKIAKFKKPADTAAIAVITHAGKRNIIIDSIDASGDEIDNLVNEIGSYKGTVLFDAEDGDNSVAFKIDADGAWTIVVKPLTSARAWNPSTTLKGVGDDVVLVRPASSGLVSLDLVFKGKHNFIVDAYSPDGVENLANEIGNFSGQVLVPDGTLLVEVLAHGGTWTATPG